MKRKILLLSALLIIAFLFISLTVTAFADDIIQSGTLGDLSWTLNETTGELVISGEGEMPSLLDNPVWLDYKDKIKTVVIEDGVMSIGNYAFKECANLTHITIPDSVTKIGYLSFWNCKSLTEITISNNCTEVNEDAFDGCQNIATATIPANAIPALPQEGVKSVVITNGTSIPSNAFSSKYGIKSITLPDTITSIGSFAFYNGDITSINIPDGVTEIGRQAFQGCRYLESVVIPNSVTTLEMSVFEGCSALRSVVLPEHFTSIGNYAFKNCKSLEAITIPEGVVSIGSSAFYSCDSLTEVFVPDSVKEIGDFAFADCESLKKVNIPDGIESVSGYAFDSSYAIETFTTPTEALYMIYLPKNGLKSIIFTSGSSIPNNAFSGCNVLEKVIFCGSESDWSRLQKNQTWKKDLDGVSFTYHNCSWDITEDMHSGTCSACGSEIQSEHLWNAGTVIKNSTHLETGLKKHICIVCQSEKTVDLEKTKVHTYGKWTEVDEDQHKRVCACGDTEYGDHSYSEWGIVTSPTEDSEGLRQKGCKCGKKITEAIPKLTHEYESYVFEPTCTEQGYTLHECKNCAHSYEDAYVDPLGHVYDNDEDMMCNRCDAVRENETEIKSDGCNSAIGSKISIMSALMLLGIILLRKRKTTI